MSDEEMQALGYTDPLPNGKQYRHGTLGGYVTAKCRCPGCMQWSADYGRSRKRRKTGRTGRGCHERTSEGRVNSSTTQIPLSVPGVAAGR